MKKYLLLGIISLLCVIASAQECPVGYTKVQRGVKDNYQHSATTVTQQCKDNSSTQNSSQKSFGANVGAEAGVVGAKANGGVNASYTPASSSTSTSSNSCSTTTTTEYYDCYRMNETRKKK